MIRNITDRELATILAALRHWERIILSERDDHSADVARRFSPEHFENQTPLTAEEVDELAQRLDCEAEAKTEARADYADLRRHNALDRN